MPAHRRGRLLAVIAASSAGACGTILDVGEDHDRILAVDAEAAAPETGIVSDAGTVMDGLVDADAAGPPVRRAFVTSGGKGGNFGALAQVDPCPAIAKGAGLGPRWVAWLPLVEDAGYLTATQRIRGSGPWYALDRSRVVVSDAKQLRSGGIAAPITMNETGAHVDGGPVWTGTNAAGADGLRCGASVPWSFGTGATGTVGEIGQTDARWTEAGELACGSGNARFYCFEYLEGD